MNTVTIKSASFPEKLQLISEGGFSGVGLWMAEIEDYLKTGNVVPVKELLEQYQLTPVEIHSFHEWQYLKVSKREKVFYEAKEFFIRMKMLGIDCPVAAIATYDLTGKIEDAVKDFRDLCRLAGDYGVRLMFEFVGWSRQFHDLKSSWEVVDGAACPNGGMLFDVFHFLKAGSTIEDLKDVDMEKVFLVHMNDVRSLPLGIKEQARRFRYFPGEGEGDLREVVTILIERGYKGFFCLEVFNEKYWAEDPAEIVRRGKTSLETLFASLR
jgi:4-hydroxyphenylpyruvate dioxygenase